MDFLQNTAASFIALVPVTLAQSLILAFVVLGIMIPFRMLSFPDLTSEGAFPLGGCVCGVLMAAVGLDQYYTRVGRRAASKKQSEAMISAPLPVRRQRPQLVAG